MTNLELETLFHYVTIAMQQASKYKELYEEMECYDNDLHGFDKPMSKQEIFDLTYLHCDLALEINKREEEKSIIIEPSEQKFTIKEFENFLLRQDNLRDIKANLCEEDVVKANLPCECFLNEKTQEYDCSNCPSCS